MKKFRTHYDNLKVSREAPDYIIRAAYKVMVQKYHPDKNPGDSRATKILSIINESYAVLSDPVKRKEHDEWILRMEAQINSHKSDAQKTSDNSKQTYDKAPNYSYGAAKGEQRDQSKINKIITKNVKNFILIIISFLLFKYFGTILGLTVIFAYFIWTKISADKILLRALSTFGVLVAGFLYWQYAVVQHTELLGPLKAFQAEKLKESKSQSLDLHKIEPNSLPVINAKSKKLTHPVWLEPSKDKNEHIQTSIGQFSKVIVDNWNMGILLDDKPILKKIIEQDGGMAYINAALDFGDNIVLFISTASGGNCGDCFHTYAVAIDANGVIQSQIEIPYEFSAIEKWKNKNDVYYSEPIPAGGKLFTAVLKNNGVSLRPRELLSTDEAPADLCSQLFYELSNSCPAISISDCEKISELNSDYTLLNLNGRGPNNNGANMRFYRLLEVVGKDPRFKFSEFKNICRNYCEGNVSMKSEDSFAKSICNTR